MAKDKRHPINTDMNDIDLTSSEVLTDKEREALQKSMAESEQQDNDLKSM